MIARPTPQQKAPPLNVSLLNGERWTLDQQSPKNFTLVVFYRGLHCPVCKKYLQLLDGLLPEFESRGVQVVAVSMDAHVRARKSRIDWGITQLNMGYGLDMETAKNWGLYLSKAVKEGEPAIFSEPGLFLIDSTNEVYYCAINSNPWGRPYLPNFVKVVDYIISADYPARGELV